MSTNLATYIAFDGNAREALNHYQEVLGGELQIMTYDDMPMPDMPFEPRPGQVAHAVLTLPGGVITGADAMEDRKLPLRDTAYSFLYTLDTLEEGQRIIDAFVAGGGEVGMPLERAPWGDHYGQVFDRFGVMWAISVETSAAPGGPAD